MLSLNKVIPVLIAFAACAAAAAAPAPSVFPEPTLEVTNAESAHNIRASEILGRMDKAYHSLSSFSATFDARNSDDPSTPICHANIAFQRRPERAMASITDPRRAVYIFNGDHIILYPSPDPEHFSFMDNVWNNLAGAGIAAVFGRLIADPKQDLLSRMLTSGYQTQNDLGMIMQLNLMPEVEVSECECNSLQAILEDGSRVLLSIGCKDHMLRRATWSRIDESGKNIYYVEQYTNIRINPALPSSTFVFKPPKGVTFAPEP